MLALAAVVAATTQCQARVIGPGSLRRGGTAGAACMLAAFKDCHAAEYTLSSYGVDTVHSETFRIERLAGGCRVYVTQRFRVIPQPQHIGARHMCKRLRKTIASDVVADRCTPPATISLTKLGNS